MLQEITLPDGSVRRLGNIAPAAGLDPTWQTYGESPKTPLIPRSEWPARMAGFDGPEMAGLPPVHDQNGVGQCNADGATAATEFVRGRQGLPYRRLSGADLYSRINGGRDQGSLLEDGMAELLTNGVGLASTSGELWKSGSWKGAASPEERAKFRLLEAFVCPTFDHVFSAVLEGFAVVSGIAWYDGYTPGPDGWLPRPSGRSGGHAIFGYKPAARGGEYGVWHQNSWGERWGLKGRFVIPESAYDGPVGGWWAVRSAVDEGGVIPIPTGDES
jgi:hypothetical protein